MQICHLSDNDAYKNRQLYFQIIVNYSHLLNHYYDGQSNLMMMMMMMVMMMVMMMMVTTMTDYDDMMMMMMHVDFWLPARGFIVSLCAAIGVDVRRER